MIEGGSPISPGGGLYLSKNHAKMGNIFAFVFVFIPLNLTPFLLQTFLLLLGLVQHSSGPV